MRTLILAALFLGACSALALDHGPDYAFMCEGAMNGGEGKYLAISFDAINHVVHVAPGPFKDSGVIGFTEAPAQMRISRPYIQDAFGVWRQRNWLSTAVWQGGKLTSEEPGGASVTPTGSLAIIDSGPTKGIYNCLIVKQGT